MNGIAEAAVELQTWLESERRAFCVIGGLAVLRWGERTTPVANATVELPPCEQTALDLIQP